jgi:ParB family chromosome partitioning protein
MLEQLNIPVSTAYWWMNRYEESAGLRKPHVSHNSGNNEWYTPPEYLDAAREVLGEIDLDPASSEIAQETVQARKYHTAEDNGLEQEWKGTIWLNPPYAEPLIHQFIDKLLSELKAGNVTEAILLTNNATDTAWFHKAEAPARSICFTRGRINFETLDGDKGSPLQGQAFFYYGENPERFDAYFREFGFIRWPGPAGVVRRQVAHGARLSEPAAIARCRAEISEIERLLKAGHPDLDGLVRALVDWSGELRLLQTRRKGETG